MNEMHPAHRSGDADAAIELGRVPEHPSSSPPLTETEIEAERERRGHGISEENMNKKNQGNVDVEEGPVEPNDGSGGGRDDAAEQKREDDAPSQGQKLGKKKIFAVMMALCLAVFLAALDQTIVATALPTMASHFHTNQSGYSWMASSYLLANAACVPVWGKVSDVWGRKPILLLVNSVFLVGSLICALAVNIAMILVGRSVQGVGGGGIIVLSYICVSDLFSVRDRPVYYGLYGATWAVASALGPIIGGAFTTSVTWRWCFYINLPIGGISLLIIFLFLRISSPKTPLLAGLRSIDWVGTLLLIGGTLMFLIGLETGGVSAPWNSAEVICLIIFGITAWTLSLLHEWKVAKYPILPIRLFKNWHNILILLVCFCHGFVFIATTYYLPLYFQSVLLANPILSGVYVLPLVLAISLTSTSTGIVIRKSGKYRELIFAGMTLLLLGVGLFIDLKPYPSWPRIVIFQIIAGIGVGPNFQSPLVAFQANILPTDMAVATATFSFVRQLSTSMSVVLGSVVYQNILSKKLHSRAVTSAVGADTANRLLESTFGGSGDKPILNSLAPSGRSLVLDAFTFSLSRLWVFYAVVAAVGVVFAALIRPVVLSRRHVAGRTGLEEQERARLEVVALEREGKDRAG